MPQLQVKKVVAVCFLEAVKVTLEHVGAHRLALSQHGSQGSPGSQPSNDLSRTYGDVRRLRDYLQRCLSSYKEPIDLDITAEDAGLLVACCRRAVEVIDLRLVDKVLPPDERQWLGKKRQVLADWAVEIAQKPLIELNLPVLSQDKGEMTRTLLSRLQHKLFGDVRERAKIAPPGTNIGQPAPVAGMTGAVPGTTPTPAAQPPVAALQQMAAPASAGNHPHPPDDAFASSAPTEWACEDDEPGPAPVLDPQKLRDPRLRALGIVDLRSYERLLAAGDYRMSTVLLASLLELALLDHVIPRRTELGLAGTPDTWNPQELSLRVLSEHATPKDRSLAFHLFASRNLLRPALQMVTPSIVTVTSFERLREFVMRVLHRMGFGNPVDTVPPGQLRAEDFQAPAKNVG